MEVTTAISKELLAPKEMTAQEVRALVDEFVAGGGVITQCPPGVALNFRVGMGDVTESPRLKRPAVIRQTRQVPSKGKSAKSKKKIK